MNAEAVELLIGKGHLPTEQALAVVESIEMAIDNKQLVTVPVMDTRCAALRADIDTRFATLRADIDTRFAKVDARFDILDAKFEARFHSLEEKWDARISTLDAKWEARIGKLQEWWEAGFAAFAAKQDATLAATRAELVRWIFLVMLGNVALTATLHAFLNTVQNVH
jgi:hypothetical protein